MSYESNYPFITGTLNGSKQDAEKNEEEYKILYSQAKNQLDSLQEEKKKLEERRDELKEKTANRIRTEEEIRDRLFKTFMNATWNAYKGIEKNAMMEENMKEKEDAYEREYSQLMDEISNLTKDKNNTSPVIN